MPPWLVDALHHDVTLPTEVLLLRLSAAFGMGCVAAAIYYLTLQPQRAGNLAGTLVMLSVLIALVTQVIGKNEARAFTLLGALAIVRFRTVVEDSRDTAFVIFAVASGMACGAGYVVAPLLCTPLVLLASWYFRGRSGPSGERQQLLVLRLGTASGAEQHVQVLLKERGLSHQLLALETVRGGAALDVTFVVPALDVDKALSLTAALHRIDGVQGVELKESSD